MPKYDVTLNRTLIQTTTLEVTAADEDAAEEKAKLKADKLKDSEWEFDSDEIEVEIVSEVTEAEE